MPYFFSHLSVESEECAALTTFITLRLALLPFACSWFCLYELWYPNSVIVFSRLCRGQFLYSSSAKGPSYVVSYFSLYCIHHQSVDRFQRIPCLFGSSVFTVSPILNIDPQPTRMINLTRPFAFPSRVTWTKVRSNQHYIEAQGYERCIQVGRAEILPSMK